MMKVAHIRRIVLTGCLLWCCLHMMGAHAAIPARTAEPDNATLSLTITGSTVRVQNATVGATLEVYSILGLRVYTYKLDATDKVLTLNLSKGWYFVKLEGLVRKIAIK